MFVYSLYQRYLQEGKAFAPKLIELLSAGSSKSSIELGESIGLDVTKMDFWKDGMQVFERFVGDLEKII